jgi:hypothetical protein
VNRIHCRHHIRRAGGPAAGDGNLHLSHHQLPPGGGYVMNHLAASSQAT